MPCIPCPLRNRTQTKSRSAALSSPSKIRPLMSTIITPSVSPFATSHKFKCPRLIASVCGILRSVCSTTVAPMIVWQLINPLQQRRYLPRVVGRAMTYRLQLFGLRIRLARKWRAVASATVTANFGSVLIYFCCCDLPWALFEASLAFPDCSWAMLDCFFPASCSPFPWCSAAVRWDLAAFS